MRRAPPRQEAAARLGENLTAVFRNEATGPTVAPSGAAIRGELMAIKIVQFLALVFTALALVPYCSHLFSLPNKIGMTQEQYFIAQLVYRNWALMGLALFPAMLLNLLFAYMLRGERPAFWFAVLACACMAITLPVFFSWTYPANVATQNWTVQPANWAELRRQWEYSHAVNAILMLASFCLLAAASVARRP
jgi:hypothetical protein